MRPTRDEMLMQMAEVVARRSTCSRAHVGVVIARQGRPLVTGYNGAPSGMPHCKHDCNCQPAEVMRADAEEPVNVRHEGMCASRQPCFIAVHAEANAIAYAARWGITLEGAELFTTLVPCLPCAQVTINAGIERVVYSANYRDNRGVELLQNAGIDLEMMQRV